MAYLQLNYQNDSVIVTILQGRKQSMQDLNNLPNLEANKQ